MAAASSKGLGLVLVLFQYEYQGRDGVPVSIKPNERYILLAKTNEHWWQVREDHGSRTFYIPAKYVKELPPDGPSLLDFAHSPQPEPVLLPLVLPVPVPVPVPKPLEEPPAPKTRAGDQVKIRLRPDGPTGYRKSENRMSTFGVPLDLQDPASLTVIWNTQPGPAETSTSSSRTTNMADDSLKHLSGFLEDVRYGNSRTQTQAIPVDPPVVPEPEDLQEKEQDPQETLIEPEEEEEEDEQEQEEQDEEAGSVKDEESNHIYESIQDLNLDLDSLLPDQLGPERSADPVTLPTTQEDTSLSPNSPIYANVSRSPPPDHTPSLPPEVISPTPLLSPQDHWQVSTSELDSTEPLSSSTSTTSSDLVISPPPPGADMSGRKGAGPVGEWKQLLDETSGRFYYYHPPTRTTRWDPPPTSPHPSSPPPLPQEDYPVEDTAVCSTNPQQQLRIPRAQLEVKDGNSSSRRRQQEVVSEVPHRMIGNGVSDELPAVQVKNWRHSVAEDTFSRGHRRNLSDFAQTSDRRNTPDGLQPTHRPELRRNLSNQSSTGSNRLTACHLLEKAGIINKTKVADFGKKIRKNWSQSWTVLHGGILTFHRDPKTAPSGTTTKSSQIVPEYTVELRGASVSWASKDKSSKKHVLELRTRQGCEYLMQYDTESIISDWFKIIQDTIRQLDQEHQSEDDEDTSDREDRERKRGTNRSSSGSAVDSEQRRVRTKLRRFLQRRPTLQSVKERGYIRDNVFGCHLDTLCHRENTTVPRFLDKCVRVVDRRGLEVDGIYRVSGNLAVIQKLRHKADHEEHLDLDDGQWEEIHVITGALKLFLRELPEPLFPFSCFDKFIAAIQVPDYSLRVSYMKDLVRSLPLPNHNTMEVLFKHLRRVIEHQDSNRMSVQSLAIVFGPTLLWPQTESANMTVHMVFQSQIVELLLNEFQTIFSQTQEEILHGPSRTL